MYIIKVTPKEIGIIKDLMKKSIKNYYLSSEFTYLSDDDYSETIYFEKFLKDYEMTIMGGEITLNLAEHNLRDLRFLLFTAKSKDKENTELSELFKKFDYTKTEVVEISNDEIMDKYINDNVIIFKKIK